MSKVCQDPRKFVPECILLTVSIALKFFRENLATCQLDVVTLDQEAQKSREFQRSPIYETNSTIRRKP